MKAYLNKYIIPFKIKRQPGLNNLTGKKRHYGITKGDARFKKLIENSYEGITLLDKDLQIVYRSRSAERINGWNTLERSKYNMKDLIHPDYQDEVTRLIIDVRDNPGTSKTVNFKSRHFDGHYIWLECTYTNFFSDPDINAIVCNFRDISEKKEADELLQQTIKELFAYKHALDESAIVAITDQAGVIKHVNNNFCKISKFSKEELIGQDHRIINSSYHDKAFIRNLWGTIARGDIWKGELKNKAKDGSFYWVDTSIVPFLNESGKPYQYVAIRSDITERKLSHEKLIESERFTKTITDNLPALIAYWDANLLCRFANKPYLNSFGKKQHEMLGINKRNLANEEEFELLEGHIKKVLEGSPQRFERTLLKSDGQKIFTDTQYLPDIDGAEIKGFYSLIYDVTAVKIAQKEVNKKTEQLENVLESITDGFIALDENLCYSYANKKVGEMLGCPPGLLLGKNIWELFPDAVGSATYQAIQTAFTEQKYVCNEDYYAPLNLWQENRVYPSGNGLSVFIRDITHSKEEEQHLKLLESVITNASDAVMITEAVHPDKTGPVILYVNEAFTKMTGYAISEVTGKTPRFLQGPATDKNELQRLREALHIGQPYETTIINYKKSGEEFWINFTVNPVVDAKGKYTHFIAIERDVTERKKTEEQLAKLNERFSLIARETNLALFEWDFEKNEIWWSESCFAMFGFDPKNGYPGREVWFSKIQAESQQTITNIVKDVQEKGLNNWQYEINYFKPDKTTGTLISRGAVIRNGQQKAVRMVGSYFDITQQKNEERQKALLAEISKVFNEPLGLKEILYKILKRLFDFGQFELGSFWLLSSDKTKIKLMGQFSNSDEIKNVFTETFEITTYNKGESLAGKVWETNSMLYWTYEDNSKNHKRAELGRSLGLKSALGMPLNYNDEVIGVLILAFGDDNGDIEKFKPLLDNFNMQIGAEIRRKQLEEELNQIFVFAPDILCVVGVDGYLKKINPAMCELLAYTEEELLSRPYTEFIHADDRAYTDSQIKGIIAGFSPSNFENRCVTRFGKIKWLAWTSAVAADDGLIYCVAKDITDRKASESHLKKLNESLEKHAKELAISNAELEQFAYVASHDLQEPLRMITGFMAQLEKKYGDAVDEKGKLYIHFAVDGAKRMRQIILDLLEFSRVGRTEENLENVNLDKVVSEILGLYRKKIEEKQATVIFNNLPTVRTHKTPIRQVLQNLISNALKYHKFNLPPVISILFSETPDYWQISVEDNGIGIEPEYFEKIFIIFQRLHNKEEYSGTGMGLAIAKKIVESLGGKIWVESDGVNGSIFYFTILKNKK